MAAAYYFDIEFVDNGEIKRSVPSGCRICCAISNGGMSDEPPYRPLRQMLHRAYPKVVEWSEAEAPSRHFLTLAEGLHNLIVERLHQV